jgi:hypothetical protein
MGFHGNSGQGGSPSRTLRPAQRTGEDVGTLRIVEDEGPARSVR